MLNISLCFNRKDFEYDVYSLIKAFYPGCEITSWYEEDGAPDGEFAYYDKILYAADQICFSIENEKHEELSAACEAVEYEKDRHETKNVLKRMVYRTLSKVSGKELPWGDLTGIRPTKIPMKMLEEGKTNVEIAKYMRETYYTSPEKTALAITIAQPGKGHFKDDRLRTRLQPVHRHPVLSEHLPVLFLRLPCVKPLGAYGRSVSRCTDQRTDLYQ